MAVIGAGAGWGGSAAQFNDPGLGPIKPGFGRILTFALDGKGPLKAPAFGHKERQRFGNKRAAEGSDS